ncbi:hypothetical protein FA13DRAFT_1731034 [Coprinellus micaceus]|uniref:Thioesterase/thiol ester dehydrase-isomerase n=1 Tax=Coprinellus micaceus TaxID=71717 RepID=A0A4Y7TI76_COPMI|nr:hypothetical protein FA13DRAFT_1731034 [Coprinellus micaceus]
MLSRTLSFKSVLGKASHCGHSRLCKGFPAYFSTTSGDSSALADARAVFLNAGFDPTSFREQHIAWGDQDPFQHVNNVRYARFFESARIQWMMSLGEEWGGRAQAENMIRGKGLSLILKTMEIQFRRPVTFPDTLLIGYAPLPLESDDTTAFEVTGSAYSLGQRKFVTHTKETLVWYNYDELRKDVPPKEALDILVSRVRNVKSGRLHPR